MCARVLPWSTSSTSNSNNNSAIAFSLATSSAPSLPLSSSSGSPPSPAFSFPAPPDFQVSLSRPPSSPASASAGTPLTSTQPGQPSTSSSISTSSSQGSGTTGAAPAGASSPSANGVVVVGVIGRVEHELSQLLDRLLESHIFGVKGGAKEQWQDSDEHSIVSSDLISGITRERKQRKDVHRSRGTDANEDGVHEGEGSFVNCAGLNGSDPGQKSESRTGKVHVKNGHYGRRKEEFEGGRIEKRHGGTEYSNAKKEVQLEVKNGGGGDEDSGKASDELKDGQGNVPWLLSKFKYHHDVEKGIVYVQFPWGALPLECFKDDSLKVAGATDGLFSTLEHHEADGMRGLLFMFSVCHVILMVQEGACFNPHLLRIFRLLQTAKHCLAPFVKAQILPGLLPPPSSASRPSPLKPISIGTRHTFGRNGAAGQNSSTVALMSGSTPVLIPGLCTPVVLFVCLEDVVETTGTLSAPATTTRTDDIPEMSPSAVYQVGSLSLSANFLTRQNLHARPASSGPALLRTNKKSEPGLRKKLQATMEAQIRFLLKKCRTVAGFGDSTPLGAGVAPGMGPRGPGNSVNCFQGVGGGGALFVLDPSRAVILLDRPANWQTDAIDAATEGIEAMLSDRESSEEILWNLGSNAVTLGEDVQAVKDFLWRQAEMLRGKGGISGNAGGGSGHVGMVAAAAAAAAASAASGLAGGTNKPIGNPPELPTFSSWLSACRVLAEALSLRLAEHSERDAIQKLSDGIPSVMKKGAVSPTRILGSVGKTVKIKPTIESSLVCLDTGAHMDLKFSAAWCKRVLPSAQEVYLKGLPPSYPTSLHKFQLDKSLRVFHSMVRGLAVPLYAEELKKKCEAIWHSGRQLCDAKSLTGKPCIYQVHEVTGPVSGYFSKDRVKDDGMATSKGASEKLTSKPHCSGVVFMHACACGRSRKLRKDPFDFESANVSFSRFPSCEELLPSLSIPSVSGDPPSGGSPWSLVQLGSARYYQPEVGLLQSGFILNQNFLSAWDIPIVFSPSETQVDTPVVSPTKEKVVELVSSGYGKPYLDSKMANKPLLRGTQPVTQTKPASVNFYGRVKEKGYLDGLNRGTSGVSDTRKGFTDITTKVNYGGESAFPPLPEKQDKPLGALAKPLKQQSGKEKKNRFSSGQDNQNAVITPSSKNDIVNRTQHKLRNSFDAEEDSNVRNLVSISSELKPNSVTKHARLYIGFEHECPHGHRFLLSDNQPERSSTSTSSLISGLGPSSLHKKQDRTELRIRDSLPSTAAQYSDFTIQETLGNPKGPSPIFPPKWTQKVMKVPNNKQYWTVKDGHGHGHSLLNSNLPIFMNCPYCKVSKEETVPNKRVTFGGTISQLQRVFLVTPPLPLRLASRPVVEFEDVSKPVKRVLEFNTGSEVELPPDSFLSLRLPFVYYSQLEGDALIPLLVNQNQPEHCARLVKNSALYVLSTGGIIEPSGPMKSGTPR